MAKRDAPQGWHREDIKAELRKRLGPVTTLSITWGYSHSAITNALLRPDYSTVIEQRVADAIGQHPHTLWPDRWTPEGTPRPRSIHSQHPNAGVPIPHRQKSEAA